MGQVDLSKVSAPYMFVVAWLIPTIWASNSAQIHPLFFFERKNGTAHIHPFFFFSINFVVLFLYAAESKWKCKVWREVSKTILVFFLFLLLRNDSRIVYTLQLSWWVSFNFEEKNQDSLSCFCWKIILLYFGKCHVIYMQATRGKPPYPCCELCLMIFVKVAWIGCSCSFIYIYILFHMYEWMS